MWHGGSRAYRTQSMHHLVGLTAFTALILWTATLALPSHWRLSELWCGGSVCALHIYRLCIGHELETRCNYNINMEVEERRMCVRWREKKEYIKFSRPKKWQWFIRFEPFCAAKWVHLFGYGQNSVTCHFMKLVTSSAIRCIYTNGKLTLGTKQR